MNTKDTQDYKDYLTSEIAKETAKVKRGERNNNKKAIMVGNFNLKNLKKDLENLS